MAMLRIHLMQNWFGYSDPAMEEALYETTILRPLAGLSMERIPDETTILNFRRLLEKHELAAGILCVINGYLGDRGLSLRQGTIVDATLIHAPSSTKNQDGKRDPEMHQTKKGNQYYFGMKAHIGVDDESGLVHSVVGTAATVADVTHVDKLLHGDENVVCADDGYTGVEKRSEHADREVVWQVAARRSTYKMLDKRSALYKAKRKIEKAKAQVRAKVEPPFRVIKRQFRLHQGTFPRAGEEHCTTGDAVCPVEPMDGPPTFAGKRRRGAPVMRKMAVARCSRRLKAPK